MLKEKGRSRKSGYKTLGIIWANYCDNIGKDGCGAGGEMWLDYGYVLKVNFEDVLDGGYESKRKSQWWLHSFSWIIWTVEVTLTERLLGKQVLWGKIKDTNLAHGKFEIPICFFKWKMSSVGVRGKPGECGILKHNECWGRIWLTVAKAIGQNCYWI